MSNYFVRHQKIYLIYQIPVKAFRGLAALKTRSSFGPKEVRRTGRETVVKFLFYYFVLIINSVYKSKAGDITEGPI